MYSYKIGLDTGRRDGGSGEPAPRRSWQRRATELRRLQRRRLPKMRPGGRSAHRRYPGRRLVPRSGYGLDPLLLRRPPHLVLLHLFRQDRGNLRDHDRHGGRHWHGYQGEQHVEEGGAVSDWEHSMSFVIAARRILITEQKPILGFVVKSSATVLIQIRRQRSFVHNFHMGWEMQSWKKNVYTLRFFSTTALLYVLYFGVNTCRLWLKILWMSSTFII